jgi:hypothetical protein
MAIDMSVRRFSAFCNIISLEKTPCTVRQVSGGRFQEGQTGHRLFLQAPVAERRGQGRTYSVGLGSEMLQRKCQGELYKGQGKLQRQKIGNISLLAVHDEDSVVTSELALAAHKESESSDKRAQQSYDVCGQGSIFIFGFGYTTCALARYLHNSDWQVSLNAFVLIDGI